MGDRLLREVEERLGDGLEEPALTDFLAGIVERQVVEEKVRGVLGVNTLKKLSDVVIGPDGSEDVLVDLGLDKDHVKAIVQKLKERAAKLQEHMYDVHAVVVYIGRGMVGHYISFIRQPDGAFFCFDDESVSRVPTVAALREKIATLGSEAEPASLRTLIYRRRCAEGEAMPLELLGPPDEPAQVTNGHAEESPAKRQRTQ